MNTTTQPATISIAVNSFAQLRRLCSQPPYRVDLDAIVPEFDLIDFLWGDLLPKEDKAAAE